MDSADINPRVLSWGSVLMAWQESCAPTRSENDTFKYTEYLNFLSSSIFIPLDVCDTLRLVKQDKLSRVHGFFLRMFEKAKKKENLRNSNLDAHMGSCVPEEGETLPLSSLETGQNCARSRSEFNKIRSC